MFDTDTRTIVRGNSFAGFAEAFGIFAKYDSAPYKIWSDVDEISVITNANAISVGDRRRLADMGWLPEKDMSGFTRMLDDVVEDEDDLEDFESLGKGSGGGRND